MQLIPVIDLMQGQVVRGVRGNRQAYRPIVSQLCEGSDPVAVAQALVAHSGAGWLYVADLDALMGRPPQQAVLRRLLDHLPGVALWLDAGFADVAAADAVRAGLGQQAAPRAVPVFGSESLASREALVRAAAQDGVLSLDRKDGQPLDPAGCWDAPALWPRRVIVMTLERVGAASGPDLQTLQAVRERAPGAFVVGAGGVRNPADLAAAAASGAGAWLVASALHDGGLPRAGG